MPVFKINNVKIAGISTCVPTTKVDNLEVTQNFTKEELEKFVETTGVRYRRIASNNQTTSDLGLIASNNLIEKMNIDRHRIDGIIFISQTPDHHLPATSIIIQDRLHLPKSTFAFDVNLGCTGYVYGLSIASSMIISGLLNNILLICGDTLSKSISDKDKSANLLFGDAATATIISNGNHKQFFSLNSDGSGADILKIKSGMFRNPISKESLESYKWDDGNIRADNQLYMDGMEIFNFTIREIAKDAQKTLEFANMTMDNIDYLIYHQANLFINSFISKKLKIDIAKTPYSLYDYGNTSSATIPLTICNSLKDRNKDLNLLMSGFGVGLSWGHCLTVLEKDAVICDIIEA